MGIFYKSQVKKYLIFLIIVLDHLNEEEDTLDVVLRKSKRKMNFVHRLIHFHGTPYVKFTVNVVNIVFISIFC